MISLLCCCFSSFGSLSYNFEIDAVAKYEFRPQYNYNLGVVQYHRNLLAVTYSPIAKVFLFVTPATNSPCGCVETIVYTASSEDFVKYYNNMSTKADEAISSYDPNIDGTIILYVPFVCNGQYGQFIGGYHIGSITANDILNFPCLSDYYGLDDVYYCSKPSGSFAQHFFEFYKYFKDKYQVSKLVSYEQFEGEYICAEI